MAPGVWFFPPRSTWLPPLRGENTAQMELGIKFPSREIGTDTGLIKEWGLAAAEAVTATSA